MNSADLSVGSQLLLAALNSYGLLPEDVRLAIVKRIDDHAIDWLQTKVFAEKLYRQILTPAEFEDLADRFRSEFLGDLENLLGELQGRYSSEHELGLYEEFKENMERAEPFFFPNGRPEALDSFYAQLAEHISELAEADEPSTSSWSEQAAKSAGLSAATTAQDSATIFDDVDD
jgi:hypothetical protein